MKTSQICSIFGVYLQITGCSEFRKNLNNQYMHLLEKIVLEQLSNKIMGATLRVKYQGTVLKIAALRCPIAQKEQLVFK
jgi:hypothetical protein